MEPLFDSTAKAGTCTGTLVIILANINSSDVFKTAVLAGIGAAVSFAVSLFLKVLVRWLKQR